MSFYEEKLYSVTINIKLTSIVPFALMERDGPITVFDAIDNAVSTIPSEVWAQIESGFNGEMSTEISFINLEVL